MPVSENSTPRSSTIQDTHSPKQELSGMDIPSLDKCPGYNLYIGGFIALRRPQALRNANITHIVSVLDWKFDDDTPLTKGYRHLHIPVDDVEDENLLEWFPRSNVFVHQGLHHWPAEQSDNTNDASRPFASGSMESGVLIHCAMGKSRSATILLAYLLWASRQNPASNATSRDEDMVSLPKQPLSVVEALMLLRQGRPIAEPNEGFMDQLHMYERMGCPTTEAELKKHKIYRRWMNKRSVEESLRVNMAPEMDSIRFEDEADEDEVEPEDDGAAAAPVNQKLQSSQAPAAKKETRSQEQVKNKPVVPVAPGIKAPDGTTASSPPQVPQVTLKCRKCRHALATSPFILPHTPPPHADPSFETSPLSSIDVAAINSPSPKCAHIFLHPLSWMRPVLSEANMEGRLSCPNPKCNTNIGKFAWTGLRCSCGGWVTPGFGVARSKVDEVEQRSSGTGSAGGDNGMGGVRNAGAGIRLPPGMRKAGGNL